MFLKVDGGWLYSRHIRKLRRAGVHEPLFYLLRVWQWALKDCGDTAPVIDTDDLEEAVSWDGDDGVLVTGLRKAGFLEHDTLALWWDESPGAVLDARKKARKRMKKVRSSRKSNNCDVRPNTTVVRANNDDVTRDIPRGVTPNTDDVTRNIADVPPPVTRNNPGCYTLEGVTGAQTRLDKTRLDKSVSHTHTPARDDSGDDAFAERWSIQPPTPRPTIPLSCQTAFAAWCDVAAQRCKGELDASAIAARWAPSVISSIAEHGEAAARDGMRAHCATTSGWSTSTAAWAYAGKCIQSAASKGKLDADPATNEARNAALSLKHSTNEGPRPAVVWLDEEAS